MKAAILKATIVKPQKNDCQIKIEKRFDTFDYEIKHTTYENSYLSLFS